jgi:hypothetical protein
MFMLYWHTEFHISSYNGPLRNYLTFCMSCPQVGDNIEVLLKRIGLNWLRIVSRGELLF